MNDLHRALDAGDDDGARSLARDRPDLAAERDDQGLLPAIRALYAGDEALAGELTPEDERLRPFEAAALRRADRLRALLEHDAAHARELSADGFTPLHGACFAGDADAARLLIEHGADLEALAEHEFIRVRPLGTAAFAGSTDCVSALLEAGADANGAGEGDFRPLHTAASNGSVEIVRALLAAGADASAALPDGRTPASLAREAGHGELADLLAGSAT